MEEYRKFLKNALFSEKTIVSYRLLSRNLKVHVNQAKEMLYDFHASENARKPRSVHATYIVIGYRKPQTLHLPAGEGSTDDDDNDTVMFDSSLPGTQTATVEKGGGNVEVVRVVELCREEELGASKADFEKVLSIHVYSLEPAPIKDFSILTGCSAEILAIHQKEDPLDMGATYGTIVNPNAKRTGSRAPPPASEPKKATISVGQERKKEATLEKKEIRSKDRDEKEVEAEEKEKKPAARASTLPAKKTAPLAAAKLKRGQSNLFSSWGNAPKKVAGSASEPNSAAQTPKTEEEQEPVFKMDSDSDGGDSGGGDKEEPNDEPTPPARDNTEDIKKRKAKDDELRKMMEDEDEGEDTKMEDDELLIKAAKIEDSPKDEGPSGTVADITAGGRRRGKRKVMKKVQSRDDDGYLVTKTEAVWESFSEDEPEPLPKPKPKAAIKGKKGAMTGQGNIMNFFAKK